MAPSKVAEMPPRPWELGERSAEEEREEERDLGVDLSWRRDGSPSGVSATSGTSEVRMPRADAFLLYELLRRSARSLIALADRIDGDEPQVRARARIAATANVFLVLGALSSRGIFLPRIPGGDEVPDASMLLGTPDACRALGEEIERFLDTIGDGTPPSPAEIAPLIDRVEECWGHLAGERRERGTP